MLVDPDSESNRAVLFQEEGTALHGMMGKHVRHAGHAPVAQ